MVGEGVISWIFSLHEGYQKAAFTGAAFTLQTGIIPGTKAALNHKSLLGLTIDGADDSHRLFEGIV